MSSDIRVINSCCKEAMQKLINEGIQVDSIVTDPPYELGFMNKSWDKSGIANDIDVWKLALQILKPGGHLLAFGGTRTYHRMACSIEDAGFEIRDCVNWIYGQGFPKSLNISKAIDKMADAEREVIGIAGKSGNSSPSSHAAKQWDGWGSSLKPAHEPCVLARKPLDKGCNIAQNVLKHGTGGINVDGCRVGIEDKDKQDILKKHESFRNSKKGCSQEGWMRPWMEGKEGQSEFQRKMDNAINKTINIGRFPANVIHDGSDVIMQEFAKYGERPNGYRVNSSTNKSTWYGAKDGSHIEGERGFKDSGTAARFFYSAKASSKDRMDSKHPTVKPIALIRYLCRLITPPNGIVLDMFAGTGTTGQAALEEGFNAILIEKESEYIDDINHRIEITKQFLLDKKVELDKEPTLFDSINL